MVWGGNMGWSKVVIEVAVGLGGEIKVEGDIRWLFNKKKHIRWLFSK